MDSTRIGKLPTPLKVQVSEQHQEREDLASGGHEHNPLLQQNALSPKSQRGWRPLELTPIFSLTFAAASIILAACLAGLYGISSTNQGLGKEREQWHYLFKYGPTAVLTLFAAFWDRAENRTKELAPWDALSKKWTPASKGILLDYISDWNVLVLPRASAAKHYNVVISISVSLVIRVLIVISTGLFISQDRVFEKQSNVPAKAFSVPAGFTGSHVDTLPYLHLQAAIGNKSLYPSGTTAKYAFQPFSVPENTSLAHPTFTANVSVFRSGLQCEIAGAEFANGGGQASTSNCSVAWSTVVDDNIFNDVGQRLMMQAMPCENSNEQRFLIGVLDLNDVSEPDGDFGQEGCGPDCSIIATKITCLLCSPWYEIVNANLTMNEGKVTAVAFSESATHKQIPGLSPWDVGLSVFQAIGAVPTQNYLGLGPAPDLDRGDTYFEDLLNLTSLSTYKNFDSLYDADTLYNISSVAFQELGAQVANVHYMSPSNDSSVEVNYAAFESRMLVQPATFVAMEVLLLIIFALCVLLASNTARRCVVSHNPSSLFDLAAILARSPGFASSLQRTGHVSQIDLARRIVSYSYRTVTVHDQDEMFKIEARSDWTSFLEEAVTHASQPPTDTFKSWRPLAVAPAGLAILLIVPVIVNATLIGLLLHSQHAQGVVTLPARTSYLHYTWTLLPAAVLLGIKVLFGAFDSAIITLQPFYMVSARCPDRERDTHSRDYRHLFALQRLWNGITHKHLAMTASAAAAMCAPFLTIIVSGLFIPGPATIQQAGSIASTTGWFNHTVPSDFSWSNSDPLAITRIMYSNASFPQWTSSELVLAQISLDAGVTADLTGNHNATSAPSQLSVEVPALRAVMNCTPHAITSARRTQNFLEINMTFAGGVVIPPPPPPPVNSSSYYKRGTSSAVGAPLFNVSEPWSYDNTTLTTKWIYSGEAGIVGYWTPAIFGDVAWLTTMGVFADIDARGNPKNVTILTCKPYVETVQANAVFNLPSFDLKNSATPINSTVQYFNDDSYWKMGGSFSAGTFGDVLLPVNMTTSYPLSGVDSFFETLFSGLDAVADPLSLVGPANTANLIDAVEHLYRMVMAQCLNTVAARRASVDALPQAAVPQIGVAIMTDPNGRRLHQSPTATYLLVGILSFMFICALVGATTYKVEGLLARSPDSIASRAGLLAGSRLLDKIPIGAEWWADKELESELASHGLSMRLGWWKDGRGATRYGVDVLRDQDDSEEEKDAL